MKGKRSNEQILLLYRLDCYNQFLQYQETAKVVQIAKWTVSVVFFNFDPLECKGVSVDQYSKNYNWDVTWHRLLLLKIGKLFKTLSFRPWFWSIMTLKNRRSWEKKLKWTVFHQIIEMLYWYRTKLVWN